MRLRRSLTLLITALCMVALESGAQTTSTTGYYQSKLKWGTSSTAMLTDHNADTVQAALDKCIEAGKAKAATSTAAIVWSCEPVRWVGRTVLVTPTCGAAPPAQTQTGTCPAGQIGGWPQTRAYVSAPYPTCWQPGTTWTPASPPAGACTTPITELPAPTGLRVAVVASDPTRLRVDWDTLAGAAAYSVERCMGVNCTDYSQIQCVTVNAFIHGPLSPGVTGSYRVRGSRAAGCGTSAGNLGAYAGPVQATVPQVEQPTAGTADLSWTPPTQNTDGTALTNLAGYRISYGQSPTALVNTIQVASAGISSYSVKNLAAGTWYFAVRAYTSSGTQSELSNTSNKVVN